MLNGHETEIGRSQYERSQAEKDRLLQEAGLMLDKVSGNAYVREGENWVLIRFRGRRKGPFMLLCVLARHPGIRSTNGQLESLLQRELPERDVLNVGDFSAQLQRRCPLIPIKRDGSSTNLPDSVNICFFDSRQPLSKKSSLNPHSTQEEPGISV